MATFKFVLSKSQSQVKSKNGQSMLMLRYIHDKRVTLFTTHKNIEDKYWDSQRQLVRKSYPGSEYFNIYIKKIKQRVEDIVNNILINDGNPTTSLVKQIYNDTKVEIQKKRRYTFFKYCDVFIEKCKKYKKEGTIKTYHTILNRLRQYENHANVKLDWHSFNMDFYYDLMQYYTDVLGCTNNGFGRIIKVIKVILNDATENGYNTHLEYKNKAFKTVREDVNNIYLDEEELQRIIQLSLEDDKRLERVRDLFIVACYTGLRFSDFSQIKKENINEKTIKLKTIKTNEWVTIPLLSPVRNIMEKYKDQSNCLPEACLNQTMNKHLKEIGQRAEINCSVVKIRNKGKARMEQVLPKYKLISTHTARRSFATNMFKMGIPSRVIMGITGHKTERAFSSYIKVTNDENAELMLRYLETV